ncbi:TetR/AcrR family transcriptional regulator [Gilvibacter sp.]|uniref:TetR/AcrR family transcriptional regulator n=1 Tax=Gilvibacter sp. TaxID=2729997 RepID=UPI003B526010
MINNKKERLHRSAAYLADQLGLHATSMKAIAKDANIAVGTIYQFYPSKDLLYGQLLADYYKDLTTSLSALTAEVDFNILIATIYTSLTEFMRKDKTRFKLFLQLRELNNYVSLAADALYEFESALAQRMEVGKTQLLLKNFSNKGAGILFFDLLCSHVKFHFEHPHDQAWNSPELLLNAAVDALFK